MDTVGIHEAKTNLPQLLKRVAKGESITITKHGIPVATLQAPESTKRRHPAVVIRELREFRKVHPLSDEEVRAMRDEGRR